MITVSKGAATFALTAVTVGTMGVVACTSVDLVFIEPGDASSADSASSSENAESTLDTGTADTLAKDEGGDAWRPDGGISGDGAVIDGDAASSICDPPATPAVYPVGTECNARGPVCRAGCTGFQYWCAGNTSPDGAGECTRDGNGPLGTFASLCCRLAVCPRNARWDATCAREFPLYPVGRTCAPTAQNSFPPAPPGCVANEDAGIVPVFGTAPFCCEK